MSRARFPLASPTRPLPAQPLGSLPAAPPDADAPRDLARQRHNPPTAPALTRLVVFVRKVGDLRKRSRSLSLEMDVVGSSPPAKGAAEMREGHAGAAEGAPGALPGAGSEDEGGGEEGEGALGAEERGGLLRLFRATEMLMRPPPSPSLPY